MIEVVVGPDYGGDVVASDVKAGSVRVEDFGYALPRLYGCRCFDQPHGAWSVVLPVNAHTQIEEDMLVAVGDEKAVDGSLTGLEALDFRSPKYFGVDKEGCGTAVRLLVLYVNRSTHISFQRGAYLSMIRTSTVAVERGILSGGAGLGNSRYSFDDMPGKRWVR